MDPSPDSVAHSSQKPLANDSDREKTDNDTGTTSAEIKKLKSELMNCRNTILKSKLEAEQSRAKLSENELLIAEMHAAYELYRAEKENALTELKNAIGEKNKVIEDMESNINYWKTQSSISMAKHTELQTEVDAVNSLLTERARELEGILQKQAAEKHMWDLERKQFSLMVDLLEQIEQAHRQKKGKLVDHTTAPESAESTMHEFENASKEGNSNVLPPSPSTTPGEVLSQKINGCSASSSADMDHGERAIAERQRSASISSFTKDKIVENNPAKGRRSSADQVFEGSGQIFINNPYGQRRPIGTRLIKVYRSSQSTPGECVFIDVSSHEAQLPVVMPIGFTLSVLFDGSELDIRGIIGNGTTENYHVVLGSPQEAVELYTAIQNVGNEKLSASPGEGASQQPIQNQLQRAQVTPTSPPHPSRTSTPYTLPPYNPQAPASIYLSQEQAPITSGQLSQEPQYHIQRAPIPVLTQPAWNLNELQQFTSGVIGHPYPQTSEGISATPVRSIPYHPQYHEYHPALASGMTHGLHQQQLQSASRQHLLPVVQHPTHINQLEQFQTAPFMANARR